MEKRKQIITFWSYVRITLGSCVRLTLVSYIIKLCKWDQEKYVLITFGSYVRITLQ